MQGLQAGMSRDPVAIAVSVGRLTYQAAEKVAAFGQPGRQARFFAGGWG
jgi:hypothetical protein